MNCSVSSGLRGRTAVVVIGAGQSGLACSHYLTRFGVDHVVLERGRVAEAWRSQRWDSLRLLTPNWQSTLPDFNYRGDDADGYMGSAQVAQFISGFAAHCNAPVEEHTSVLRVDSCTGGYRVSTDRGDWLCAGLIVASGAFARANVPALAASLPADMDQLTSHQYRNPDQLRSGGVLVVGAGASGVQIAHELARSGRRVSLAVGEHLRMPRRYRGRDIQYWMQASGLLDESWREVEDLPRLRRLPSPQLAGTPEGRDMDLDTLRAVGVETLGRLAGVAGNSLQFSGSLANVIKLADLKMNRLLDAIDEHIESRGLPADPAERPALTAAGDKPRLAVKFASGEFSTVLWTCGYRPDYRWLNLPLLDGKGMPAHRGGVAELPGVYFMGLPFMRRRKSSFICGAGDDARDIVHHLLMWLGRPVESCLQAVSV
ncbi:NAD(P)-binding domain-containing protein [Haliea sp. E17]|uniref:NAD(P)-binding domain-containing protein n=1 Tax=Haliea sp. E17 TaxID=3401576 RepID=UPI003AAE07D6